MDFKPDNTGQRPVCIVPFISALGALYTAYLALDLFWPHMTLLSSLLKYTGIILCFLYALRSFEPIWIQQFSSPKRIFPFFKSLCRDANRSFILLLSFFAVLFSDYFLLFTNHAMAGVLLFALIQILYFIYHSGVRKIPLFWGLSLLPALPLSFIFTGIFRLHGLLPVAGAIYISMLLVNIIFAVRITVICKTPAHVLFAAGLILYLLCDINVGLINAGAFFSIHTPHSLDILTTLPFRRICAFFVWFFYLPAQVLAALSLACQTGNPAPCTATPDPAHEV